MAVIIIDEFSRGDAGRIFGEALTYMESDYRDQPFRLASGRNFMVPANVVIIATMNPNDRSVSAVDVAMQRRFEVIRMRPSTAILKVLLERNEVDQDLVERVLEFFTVCQEVMPHGGLGHAYFVGVENTVTLERLWKYKLAPLFEQELQFVPEDLARITSAYEALMAE
jgi:5-methylcytosine-specific restriction protein B